MRSNGFIEGRYRSEVGTRPRLVLVARGIIVEHGKILLVERAAKDRSEPGSFEFPGGKLDPGETFREALEQEIFEETGLLVSPARGVAYVEERMNVSGPYKGLLYRVEAVICRKDAGRVKLSPEHDSFVWTTLPKAERLHLTGFTAKALVELQSQILREIRLR